MTEAQAIRPTVLVVEDEFIIALDLSETVRDLGFGLDGPYSHKALALQAIEKTLPDAAILDINVADGEVFPLADALAQHGVPIIFHSSQQPLPDACAQYPRAVACTKPCPPDHLVSVLQQVVGR